MNRNNRDVQHFVTRRFRLRRTPETSSIVRSLLVLGLGLVFFLTPLVSSDAAPNKEKHLAIPPAPESIQEQQLNPPFNIQTIIEKAEHFILNDPDKSHHYWVEDQGYRVDFFPEGVIYYPVRDGDPSYQKGIRIRVNSIGSSMLLDDSEVTVHENKIVYQRNPSVQEVYEARKEGVEQSWIIQRPLSNLAGDLTIRGEIETVLSALPNGSGGIDFVDQDGRYVTSYGQVTVIDHNGKKITINPVLEGSRLTITIPVQWLAQAVYPIVVDPLIGTGIRVDSLTTTDNYPAIAFDGTNYLIVWQTGTPNATGTGSTAIRGARVSNTGTVLDATPLTIGDATNQDDEFPSVTYDSVNSRYIVVWMTWNSATSADIFRNTVTTAGVTGTTTNILTGGTQILAYPTVACCDVNNNYAVVYGQSTAAGTTITSYGGQTYNRTTHIAATVSNPAATVSSATITPDTEPRSDPRLYSLSSAQYLLTWETFGVDTNGDISANLLTVTATPSYTWGIQVSVAATGATLERYPRAAFDGANALIVYQQGGTTASDIYGQFVTPGAGNLTLSGVAFAVSAVAGSGQMTPDVAYTAGSCSANPMNRYMVVWQDYRNNATNPDIYGSPVTTAAVVETAVAISTNTAYTKQYPVITADSGNCGYMVAWSDYQNNATTSSDIYAQKVGYPNISNLSPASGGEGNTISINGTGFGSNPGVGSRSTAINNVKLGSTQISDANFLVWTETPSPRIDFTVPDGVAPGTYATTVTAGGWTSNAVNFNIALVITSSLLPSGRQWLAYPGATLAASGGTLPYSWSISVGILPAGLTLNSATGAISGTPTGAEATEIVSFTVKVTDSSVPANTATQDFSIIVYKLNTITVTPANPIITRGQQIQFTAGGTWTDNYNQPNINSLVTWQSSNTLVATIDTSGLATGQGLGTATVSATK